MTLASRGRRWDVKVYSLSINSSHCHLLLRASDRRDFQNFLRVLAGQIAIRITGAGKGSALRKRFFDKLAWTRIVEWGKAFDILKRYIQQNQLEAVGAISYVPRKAHPKYRRAGRISNKKRRCSSI